MADEDFVIEAEAVSKRFGHLWAVRDLTLRIPRNRIFCLLGPSGSGKTSTIRMMLGVYRPDSGTLTVWGKPTRDIKQALHHRIGYLPQFFVLHPTLTIEENLNFVGMLYGLRLRQRRRRIRELLEWLELWPYRHKVASRISGGMRRRLSLAAALIHEPELLFLDEPTAGIDPILRTKLWKEFRRLSQLGTTLIVTTQYVVEAEYGDDVAILSSGELAALGTPRELRRQALGGDTIEVHTTGNTGFTADLMETLKSCTGVVKLASPAFNALRVTAVDSASALPKIMACLQENGIEIETVSSVIPAFDDAFVRLVEQHRAAQ
jgi:ABC-2 type transport system ATP-binding protein